MEHEDPTKEDADKNEFQLLEGVRFDGGGGGGGKGVRLEDHHHWANVWLGLYVHVVVDVVVLEEEGLW